MFRAPGIMKHESFPIEPVAEVKLRAGEIEEAFRVDEHLHAFNGHNPVVLPRLLVKR